MAGAAYCTRPRACLAINLDARRHKRNGSRRDNDVLGGDGAADVHAARQAVLDGVRAGQLALAYKVFRCWVSEFQALPDLDANANAVAIQHLKLENEGWLRDIEVAEPAEPTFTDPA